MSKALGYAARDAAAPLGPLQFDAAPCVRKTSASRSSIAASATPYLHQVRNHWHEAGDDLPCVSGHEIVGRVVEVGPAVRKFKVATWPESGAWSTPAASATCLSGEEQFCAGLPRATYNFADPS